MTSWRASLVGPSLLMVVALILTGCPKRPEVQVGDVGASRPEATAAPHEKAVKPESLQEAPVPGPEDKSEPGMASHPSLKDVLFDFNRDVLNADAKNALQGNIKWLKANPQVRVVIEGHADARGSPEYNLALGERRAKAVRDYLVTSGIDPHRLLTISRGERRPFAKGHGESAWKQNRRVHFVMIHETKAESSPESSSGLPVISTPPLTLGP